jgi:hypothetical protein
MTSSTPRPCDRQMDGAKRERERVRDREIQTQKKKKKEKRKERKSRYGDMLQRHF